MSLKAVLLNCTLKKSPEVSNTEALMRMVIGHLDDLGVESELIRVVDYEIPFGVVSDMGEGDESMAIVRAVMAMGRSLGIVTIAEGVETREQLDYLKVLGCEFAQGLQISAPLAAEDARGLLDAGVPAR